MITLLLLSTFALPLTQAIQRPRSILVAGSLNADTFLPVARFPSPGENLTLLQSSEHCLIDVPGGKGMNQAIAVSKLCRRTGEDSIKSAFLGQFGNDAVAEILRGALVENGVDISLCGQSSHPSGRGYVMIVPRGEVSAVIMGGSNQFGWNHFDESSHELSDRDIEEMIRPYSFVQLQCEIPHHVNLRLAKAAKRLGMTVMLDAGGEDRVMDRDLLECCDYLVPNESELERLSSYFERNNAEKDPKEIERIQSLLGPDLDAEKIYEQVSSIQSNGANDVLVTLGAHGSILFKKKSMADDDKTNIIYQPACSLPQELSVVDETGAGDCYRAAFAVYLMEQCTSDVDHVVDDDTLCRCMKFASAAGAMAVTRRGAVPAIPSRDEVEELILWNDHKSDIELATATVPRGGMKKSDYDGMGDDFPFMFGSRLNSMKDRLDLLEPSEKMSSPRDFVRRQASIKGLGCVDFNYPQHFHDWTPVEARRALDEVGLVAGAVCLRYPSKFARGAMNHPDPTLRREAIEMTKDAARVAQILGCDEVVVWSAYDGYDYPFQVNYKEKWSQLVDAFQVSHETAGSVDDNQ
jgi:ribokinase